MLQAELAAFAKVQGIMYIDKEKEHSNVPQRAPLEREAPVPLKDTNVLRDLFKNNRAVNFDQNTGFHGGPSARRKGYRLALWSALASFIDLLILISMSSIFIMVFSLIMKTPVGSIFGALKNHQDQTIFFIETFCLCGWVYLITVRSIMGSTIGEWACNIRLGQPHERLRSNYILKVALRSTLILASGVVTLPLISLLIGKDLAGIISGLRLFSLK